MDLFESGLQSQGLYSIKIKCSAYHRNQFQGKKIFQRLKETRRTNSQKLYI